MISRSGFRLSLLIAPQKGVHSAHALPFATLCSPKGSAFRFCVTFCYSLFPKRECIPLLRYLLLLPVPPKGVHSAHALPFTAHCAPKGSHFAHALPFTAPRASKGSAFRSCVTFCCSLSPQRECIPLLRYLSLLPVPQKGVQYAHALPFAAH